MNPISLEEPIAPPIFIVSTVRSGSTLLRYILDTHGQICCPGELGLGVIGLYMTGMLSRTLFHPGPGHDVNPTSQPSLDVTRRVLSGIMNAYARSRGKAMWCEKAPMNVEHLDLLADIFPTARFICLYRQCLDVVQSCLDASKYGFMLELAPYAGRKPDNLVDAMITGWCEKTERVLSFEALNRSRCFRLRYEDLVGNTDASLRALFGFLAVEWEPDIASRTFLTAHDHGGGDAKVMFTRKIESGSVGRGSEIPATLISPAQQRRFRGLQQQLSYALPPSAPLQTPGVAGATQPAQPAHSAKPAQSADTSPTAHGGPAASPDRLHDIFSIEVPARLKEYAHALGGTHATVKFQVTGSTPRSWFVRLDGPQSRVLQGDHAADCTITAQESVIIEMASGRLNPLLALQDGRMQAKGKLELLQKLRWIL